jgi:hypothetical protein
MTFPAGTVPEDMPETLSSTSPAIELKVQRAPASQPDRARITIRLSTFRLSIFN